MVPGSSSFGATGNAGTPLVGATGNAGTPLVGATGNAGTPLVGVCQSALAEHGHNQSDDARLHVHVCVIVCAWL